MTFWTRFIHRKRREQDLDDEISAHLTIEAQDRIEHGESTEEAHARARRDFGSVALVKDATRDAWGWTWLERLLRDQRFILRQMRRSPSFAVVSIGVLGLGLGTTITMFTIVNSVLLEPLGFAGESRLYIAVNIPPPRLQSSRYWHVNGRHAYEWRSACTSCEEVAMAEGIGLTLTGDGEPERVPALRVSYNFFRTLGVSPEIGRDFRPEEELPGQFRQVILADALWRSRFAGDPAIVGRPLNINGERYTVIGVMPAGFRLPTGNQWGPGMMAAAADQPLMFRPLGQDMSRARGAGNNNFIGLVRLRPGIQPDRALAELNALIAPFVKQFNIELETSLLPLHETVVRNARTGIWLLLGMGIAIWLIVCVNVANLIVVRTAGRDREAGIRLALGSSRAELFRLVLNEAFILVAFGSCVGAALANVFLRVFVAWAPAALPRVADIQTTSRTWLMAIAAGIVSTLVCGVLPGWRLTRKNPQESLKEGASTATAQGNKVRFRELMLVAEVALSTVLLVIGGLLLLSFVNVMRVPKGFEAAHVISQDVSLSGAKFQDPDRIRYVDEALEGIAALPGVRSVGVTNQMPLRGETWICELRDAGPPAREPVAAANFRFVSAGYWAALGIPLKRGRLLESSDRNRAVAIIGERAATLLWPGMDPVGKRIGACGPDALEVIGVVGDVRADVEKEAPVTVYQPHWSSALNRPSFVIRADAEPSAIADRVRTVLRSLDADVPVSPAVTMEEVFDVAVAQRRFQMNLVVAFAVTALLLASVGIYGVVSFAVAQTTPEIGIRMALGAHTQDVMAMVMRRGLVPVFAGLLFGLLGAFLASRLVSSQLYGVVPNEPWTMVTVSVLLMLVGMFACWIPARRASRINPLLALRFE